MEVIVAGYQALRRTIKKSRREWEKNDYLHDYLPTPVNRARKTFGTQGRQLLCQSSTRFCLLVQHRAILSRPNYIQHILVLRFDHGTVDFQQSLFFCLKIWERYLRLAWLRISHSRAHDHFFTFSSKRETARNLPVISDPFIQSLSPNIKNQTEANKIFVRLYHFFS